MESETTISLDLNSDKLEYFKHRDKLDNACALQISVMMHAIIATLHQPRKVNNGGTCNRKFLKYLLYTWAHFHVSKELCHDQGPEFSYHYDMIDNYLINNINTEK